MKSCRAGIGFVLLLAAACAAQEQARDAMKPVDVVKAYVAAWNQHDYAAFDRLLAADAVHEDLGVGFRGQGAASIKGFMKDVLQQEPDLQWTPTHFIESGPNVAMEWTWSATYTGDSPNGPVKAQRVSGRGMSSIVVENGKIKRFSDYYDNASFFPKSGGGK